MTKIIPAILSTTEQDYVQKINRLNQYKNQFDWVQIDLMDSKFVQNKSIGPDVIAKNKTDFQIEAHLMVEYPENWTDELIKASVQRIIFPSEDSEGILERIEHIKNHGISVGLSVNPGTSIEILVPFLNKIDVVLIMSVNPGFGGQEFIPETLNKIEEISKIRLRDDLKFKIEVDGGVGEDNIKQIVEVGADFLVVGSHLFKYDNLELGLEKLIRSANG